MILEATVGNMRANYRIASHNTLPMVELLVASIEAVSYTHLNNKWGWLKERFSASLICVRDRAYRWERKMKKKVVSILLCAAMGMTEMCIRDRTSPAPARIYRSSRNRRREPL